MRAQIQEFRKSGSRDYLLVEGSSVTAHGCDPKVVRQELAVQGLDVGVLQFSAQGANHFERTFFDGCFLAWFDARGKRAFGVGPGRDGEGGFRFL